MSSLLWRRNIFAVYLSLRQNIKALQHSSSEFGIDPHWLVRLRENDTSDQPYSLHGYAIKAPSVGEHTVCKLQCWKDNGIPVILAITSQNKLSWEEQYCESQQSVGLKGSISGSRPVLKVLMIDSDVPLIDL